MSKDMRSTKEDTPERASTILRQLPPKNLGEEYFSGTKIEKRKKCRKLKCNPRIEDLSDVKPLKEEVSAKSAESEAKVSRSNIGDRHDDSRVKILPAGFTKTIWNSGRNVVETLFPDAESEVIQRYDEDEMTSLALAESIATAQLESFKRESLRAADQGDRFRCSDSDDEGGWNKIRSNLPDKPEELGRDSNASTRGHCHGDDNDDNATSRSNSVGVPTKSIKVTSAQRSAPKCSGDERKESGTANAATTQPVVATPAAPVLPTFVDKYGRVNGYTERHIFMGRGARMKEQEFLKQNRAILDASGMRKGEGTDKCLQRRTGGRDVEESSGKGTDKCSQRRTGGRDLKESSGKGTDERSRRIVEERDLEASGGGGTDKRSRRKTEERDPEASNCGAEPRNDPSKSSGCKERADDRDDAKDHGGCKDEREREMRVFRDFFHRSTGIPLKTDGPRNSRRSSDRDKPATCQSDKSPKTSREGATRSRGSKQNNAKESEGGEQTALFDEPNARTTTDGRTDEGEEKTARRRDISDDDDDDGEERGKRFATVKSDGSDQVGNPDASRFLEHDQPDRFIDTRQSTNPYVNLENVRDDVPEEERPEGTPVLEDFSDKLQLRDDLRGGEESNADGTGTSGCSHPPGFPPIVSGATPRQLTYPEWAYYYYCQSVEKARELQAAGHLSVSQSPMAPNACHRNPPSANSQPPNETMAAQSFMPIPSTFQPDFNAGVTHHRGVENWTPVTSAPCANRDGVAVDAHYQSLFPYSSPRPNWNVTSQAFGMGFGGLMRQTRQQPGDPPSLNVRASMTLESQNASLQFPNSTVPFAPVPNDPGTRCPDSRDASSTSSPHRSPGASNYLPPNDEAYIPPFTRSGYPLNSEGWSAQSAEHRQFLHALHDFQQQLSQYVNVQESAPVSLEGTARANSLQLVCPFPGHSTEACDCNAHPIPTARASSKSTAPPGFETTARDDGAGRNPSRIVVMNDSRASLPGFSAKEERRATPRATLADGATPSTSGMDRRPLLAFSTDPQTLPAPSESNPWRVQDLCDLQKANCDFTVDRWRTCSNSDAKPFHPLANDGSAYSRPPATLSDEKNSRESEQCVPPMISPLQCMKLGSDATSPSGFPFDSDLRSHHAPSSSAYLTRKENARNFGESRSYSIESCSVGRGTCVPRNL